MRRGSNRTVQMEFAFNINDLLPDLITVVDDKLAPFRSRIKNDRLVSIDDFYVELIILHF